MVHEASPLVVENMKWSMPFFEYKGVLCQMAAFKNHCAFGFWKVRLLNDPGKVLKLEDAKAGSLGDIKSIDDLPPKYILIDFVKQAIALNEENIKPKAKPVKEKAEITTPDYFLEFLSNHPKAKESFEKFSNSHRKEYVSWIIDAKTDATRLKRMQTAAEWLEEGKSRNWKYQK